MVVKWKTASCISWDTGLSGTEKAEGLVTYIRFGDNNKIENAEILFSARHKVPK